MALYQRGLRNYRRSYHKVVEATQWFKNGDHPLDSDYPNQEGAVVRFFRSSVQEQSGFLVHDVCGRVWHDHGWIDPGERDIPDGYVCPGDWVITDAPGKYRRVAADIFAATYEPV